MSIKFNYLLFICLWSTDFVAALIGKAARSNGQSLVKQPRDVSVIRASSTSVVVTWVDGNEFANTVTNIFQVAYRPVTERYDFIQRADGDKRAILLDTLRPGTRYRLHVTAITNYGSSNHSDIVLFDTDNPRNDSRAVIVGALSVRPEEVAIVVVVLALWVFVIVLFFNKWGKIRMLEPYQPDYKHPRTPSCPHILNNRLSQQLATFTSVERERLLYSGPAHVHCAARPRQNSVFVGSPYVRYTLSQATPSRRVKSAEDINAMVLNATAPQKQHHHQQQLLQLQNRMQTTNV